MEKVLRVRVKGIGTDPWGEPTIFGEQVWRFIGNEEVEQAQGPILDDWMHYSKPELAPVELIFKFERVDIGKQMQIIFSRDFIDDNPYEVRKRIIQAVGEAIIAT